MSGNFEWTQMLQPCISKVGFPVVQDHSYITGTQVLSDRDSSLNTYHQKQSIRDTLNSPWQF